MQKHKGIWYSEVNNVAEDTTPPHESQKFPKAKIVFSFAGTGDTGEQYAENEEITGRFNQDVIRVYFRGCQHKQIGNGFIFPDIESVADRIRKIFDENKTIDLGLLHKEFGDGIVKIKGPQDYRKVEITDIGLKGFSRGAVTTFAVAKKLDELNIPMDIIANQAQ